MALRLRDDKHRPSAPLKGTIVSAKLTFQQPLGCLVMFLYQLAFIYGDEVTFFDDELSTNDGVIGVDGLTEDNR